MDEHRKTKEPVEDYAIMPVGPAHILATGALYGVGKYLWENAPGQSFESFKYCNDGVVIHNG